MAATETAQTAATLEDTGERVIPSYVDPRDGVAAKLLAQHLARYEAAARLAADKAVLDIACGAGFGALMMAEAGASAVTAVDIDPDVIEFARAHYAHPAIRYLCGDGHSLPRSRFDLAVSFETLEHVDDPDRFMDLLVSLTAPGGTLMVSATVVPTSDLYPYHRHDLDEAALRGLFAARQVSITDELFQHDRMSPQEVRYSMRAHRVSPPFGEIARRPLHYLKRGWRVLVREGLDYRNLMLVGRVP